MLNTNLFKLLKQPQKLVHAGYFALLSLLTASADYSECGWGIPRILPRMWISVMGVAQTHSQLPSRDSEGVCVCVHAHSPFNWKWSSFIWMQAWKIVPVSGHQMKTEACPPLTSLVMFRSSACRTGQQPELNIRMHNQPVQLLQLVDVKARIYTRNLFIFSPAKPRGPRPRQSLHMTERESPFPYLCVGHHWQFPNGQTVAREGLIRSRLRQPLPVHQM